MKTDLTSKAAALAHLRSLDPATIIEIPGAYSPRPNRPEVDAIAVITEESPNAWAASTNRWEWTAGELLEALA